MRDAADVIVERAIVHKIDHLGPDSVFSELELDLEPLLQEYFSRQIANVLGDENTHAAKFAAGGSPDARNECLRLLGDDGAFVPASQKLAEMLHAAMQGDNRIAPGSLAVCRYVASNYSGMRFLALIKLDPGEALVQKIEKVKGRQRVSFDVQSNVMPTDRERLQKAALIPSAAVSDKYDLLLLDQQVVRAAAFFAGKFLNTTIAFDAKTTTELLYMAMQNGRNRANLTPEESFAVQDFLPSVLSGERATVSGLVKRLPVAPEKQKVFRQEITALLPGEQKLELDPEFATTLLKKTKFRGDHGIRFEVLSEHFHKVVKDESQRVENGKVITTLVIDVTNLQWSK